MNQEAVRRLVNLRTALRRTNSCGLTLPVFGNTRTEPMPTIRRAWSRRPSGSGSPGLTTIHGNMTQWHGDTVTR
jgi:hypothetical protein